MFCPHINRKCNPDCMYFRKRSEEKGEDKCDLFDAVQTLRSLQSPHNHTNNKLNAIEKRLIRINDATSNDQTESFNIMNIVYEIKEIISKNTVNTDTD